MTELIKSLGIATIFSGALVIIVRKLIDHFFSKDLEKFKAELQKEAIKYKTQYETLHIERANVIKEVYKRLVTTEGAFRSLLKPFRLHGEVSDDEKEKILTNEYNGLIIYYLENRVFFEEDLAKELDAVIILLQDIQIQRGSEREARMAQIPLSKEEYNKAWKMLKDKLPPIKTSIEQQFRTILGIE